MVRGGVRLGVAAAILAATLFGGGAQSAPLEKPADAVRVATFNAQLSRRAPNRLISELRDGGGAQIDAVVEIIQRVRPDILLLNEIDFDDAGEALALFEAELAVGRNGAGGVGYAHRFLAPVNTGVPSGFDLDRDGAQDGPGDAWGWGRHPGQYGMAVLSSYPIDAAAARTFQSLRWADAAAADADAFTPPTGPNGAAYYPSEAWALFRLSSKSHWDVPTTLPSGRRLHLLASHPTPPVFDGPEDRNGLRNAAEIRFWAAYLSDADWIVDDQGRRGGLAAGASAVVLGDFNADPNDGDGRRAAIASLLDDGRLQDVAPRSAGAVAAAQSQSGANDAQSGDPALDTADWRDAGSGAPGNLRVDYVLPTRDLTALGAGVFWPAPEDPLARLLATREMEGRDGRRFMVDLSSDHRLVWVDLKD